jgi:hypothetical protein
VEIDFFTASDVGCNSSTRKGKGQGNPRDKGKGGGSAYGYTAMEGQGGGGCGCVSVTFSQSPSPPGFPTPLQMPASTQNHQSADPKSFLFCLTSSLLQPMIPTG